MPGWTWEYVEETVTAARLEAIVRAIEGKGNAGPASRISLEEFRSQFPNGMSL